MVERDIWGKDGPRFGSVLKSFRCYDLNSPDQSIQMELIKNGDQVQMGSPNGVDV